MKKKIYEHLLCYIEEENKIDLENLNTIINIQSNSEEFKSNLYVIREICKNHHRSKALLIRIEEFLSNYKKCIKKIHERRTF